MHLLPRQAAVQSSWDTLVWQLAPIDVTLCGTVQEGTVLRYSTCAS